MPPPPPRWVRTPFAAGPPYGALPPAFRVVRRDFGGTLARCCRARAIATGAVRWSDDPPREPPRAPTRKGPEPVASGIIIIVIAIRPPSGSSSPFPSSAAVPHEGPHRIPKRRPYHLRPRRSSLAPCRPVRPPPPLPPPKGVSTARRLRCERPQPNAGAATDTLRAPRHPPRRGLWLLGGPPPRIGSVVCGAIFKAQSDPPT